MLFGMSRARLARLYLGATLALGAAAYVGGVVSGDICNAYRTGSIGAAPEGARPLFCS